jgi:hypothetical protein
MVPYYGIIHNYLKRLTGYHNWCTVITGYDLAAATGGMKEENDDDVGRASCNYKRQHSK